MTVIETPVSHGKTAEDVVEKIRALHALIPGFELVPQPLHPSQRPRGHRTLPDSFFLPIEHALTRSQRFADTVAVTPQMIREMLDHGAAYLPVAAEAERFARGIRYAVALRRGEVGKLVFDAYRLAQAMNVALALGLVVPEVEEAKASFRTRRRATPAPTADGKP